MPCGTRRQGGGKGEKQNKTKKGEPMPQTKVNIWNNRCFRQQMFGSAHLNTLVGRFKGNKVYKRLAIFVFK